MCIEKVRRRKYLSFSLLFLLVFLYFLIEAFVIKNRLIVMDEYVVAHKINSLNTKVPYKDFNVTKNVLGYYLYLPFLNLVDGIWEKLITLKLSIALVNSIFLFSGAFLLSKNISWSSILLSLLLMIFSTTFVDRSSEVRVDMLSANFAFLSLIFLIQRKHIFSGLLISLSFLSSQKGIYYIFSSELVYISCFFWRFRERENFSDFLKFNASMLLPILTYLIIFSVNVPFIDVVSAVFFVPGDIVLENVYELGKYWIQTLSRNPIFYAMAIFAIGSLAYEFVKKKNDSSELVRILLIYSLCFTTLCIWHKRPWPYYFVMLAPVIMILNSYLIDFLKQMEFGSYKYAGISIFIVLGLFYPANHIFVKSNLGRDHQKKIVETAEAILLKGDSYWDGVNMIYTRDQPILNLSNLTVLQTLRNSSMKGMFFENMYKQFEKAPIKLVIYTYRYKRLPRKIAEYIKDNYLFRYSNIGIYSPLVGAGEIQKRIKFAGRYEVLSPGEVEFQIDGKDVSSLKMIDLSNKKHSFYASKPIRLVYIPESGSNLLDLLKNKELLPLFTDFYTF